MVNFPLGRAVIEEASETWSGAVVRATNSCRSRGDVAATDTTWGGMKIAVVALDDRSRNDATRRSDAAPYIVSGLRNNHRRKRVHDPRPQHDGQCNEKATRRRAESTRSTVLRTKGRAHHKNRPRQHHSPSLEPTDSSTKDQAAYDDDRQAHLETLSADNARLCAELSSLRAQLNRATTSERKTLHESHQNASLPTEQVTTPTFGLHHSVPADVTMSSGSTRPPSLNDGTNQDAARPAAPTVSTHEGEPSMAQILAALVNTQALLAHTLSRGPLTTSPIQIHSTSDTSSSIPLFDGTPQQSTHEWITQEEEKRVFSVIYMQLMFSVRESTVGETARRPGFLPLPAP
ncbi:hypothetical protein HPB51_000306 [Rhipicephalus microplus]|uniref:Uncharacterized protein n=1 Tax=Rhipicephalus microplus TaxID=6941 RepID=A0A9J6EKN2_RHIMP|nr:hypothetical protein HPB51_000306 [Rhipicephalus microplus]